ncbi:plasmalemma vesicle-associated protein [Arapaima gigas]
MYNSSFSRPPLGLEVKNIRKSNGKSCGYYLRIVFFFSSLIQSLIIVSLVLFLVYGQPEQSAEGKRVQDLEESLKQVNSENHLLKEQEKNLTEMLVKRNAEKVIVNYLFTACSFTQNQCEVDKKKAELRCSLTIKCPNQASAVGSPLRKSYCVQSNFTRTTQELKSKMEETTKMADRLQREKLSLEEQLTTYIKLCKEDFATPLKGIQDVTKAFLTKIDNLFSLSTFPLSCENQQKQIEKVRSSCTNLSKDVEEKFQHYLDNVGEKVTSIQGERSKLMVENFRLNETIKQCPQKRLSRSVTSGALVQDSGAGRMDVLQDLEKAKLVLRGQDGLQGATDPHVQHDRQKHHGRTWDIQVNY